jgi:hypothetical protein
MEFAFRLQTYFENRAFLGYCAPISGIFLPTFRGNLLVPWSGVKNPKCFVCPETSARNCHYSQCNNPEERIFHLLRGESLKLRIITMFRVLKANSGSRSPVVLEQWLRQMVHISKVPTSIPGVSICFLRRFSFSDNIGLLSIQTNHKRHTSVYILTPISVHCSQLRDLNQRHWTSATNCEHSRFIFGWVRVHTSARTPLYWQIFVIPRASRWKDQGNN